MFRRAIKSQEWISCSLFQMSFLTCKYHLHADLFVMETNYQLYGLEHYSDSSTTILFDENQYDHVVSNDILYLELYRFKKSCIEREATDSLIEY